MKNAFILFALLFSNSIHAQENVLPFRVSELYNELIDTQTFASLKVIAPIDKKTNLVKYQVGNTTKPYLAVKGQLEGWLGFELGIFSASSGFNDQFYDYAYNKTKPEMQFQTSWVTISGKKLLRIDYQIYLKEKKWQDDLSNQDSVFETRIGFQLWDMNPPVARDQSDLLTNEPNRLKAKFLDILTSYTKTSIYYESDQDVLVRKQSFDGFSGDVTLNTSGLSIAKVTTQGDEFAWKSMMYLKEGNFVLKDGRFELKP